MKKIKFQLDKLVRVPEGLVATISTGVIMSVYWTLEKLKEENKDKDECARCNKKLSILGHLKKYCSPCEHELGQELTYKQKKERELKKIGEDKEEITQKISDFAVDPDGKVTKVSNRLQTNPGKDELEQFWASDPWYDGVIDQYE